MSQTIDAPSGWAGLGVEKRPSSPSLTARRRHLPLGLVPILPLAGLVLIGTCSLLAGLYPVSPTDVVLTQRLQPPLSPGHVLGSDPLGRDILARLLAGSRLSVILASSAVAIGAAVGVGLGVSAAQQGGRVDSLIMRFTEIWQGIPLLVVAVLLAAVYGPSLLNVIIIVGLFQWPQVARITRGQTLSLKEKQFVLASRVSGSSSWMIARRHFLPNILSTVCILGSIIAGTAVLAEAGLSFFGAGVPPAIPSWGGMVSDGRQYITSAWWIALFPGLAISLLVLCLNLLGDYLRDVLDPQLRAQ
jgi:peptide/nickel transport system permease protein